MRLFITYVVDKLKRVTLFGILCYFVTPVLTSDKQITIYYQWLSFNTTVQHQTCQHKIPKRNNQQFTRALSTKPFHKTRSAKGMPPNNVITVVQKQGVKIYSFIEAVSLVSSLSITRPSTSFKNFDFILPLTC